MRGSELLDCIQIGSNTTGSEYETEYEKENSDNGNDEQGDDDGNEQSDDDDGKHRDTDNEYDVHLAENSFLLAEVCSKKILF